VFFAASSSLVPNKILLFAKLQQYAFPATSVKSLAQYARVFPEFKLLYTKKILK
jgi:hypothetical protein